AALVTIVGFVIAMFVARMISKPVQKLNTRLSSISEGGGDLTARLEVRTKEELGTMARLFNGFVDHIAAIIKVVQNNSNKLFHSTAEIDMAMTQANDSINMISGDIHQIIDGIHTTTSVIQQTNAGIEELTVSAGHINE
ncbi:hypothetical protein ADUPG1_002382, partial [Aduncisulcus paluster]